MSEITDSLLGIGPGRKEVLPNLPELDTSTAFNKGLRAGVEDLKGQGRALLGQGAEIVGANEIAAQQRAASLANQQEAERIVEGVPQTVGQVNGLRDAWDYGTGLVGRAAPGLLPMAAGAALGGIPGMIAATAPSTIGGQFEAQQADPAQAAAPLLDRTLTGAAAGTAEAGVMSVLPAFMGGKLFRKAAAGAVAKPFARAAAENVGEAVLGNAAAGNVGARIGQGAAGFLNPERDTGGDEQQRVDATVNAGVMGLPFAALGTAGAMRGARAPKPKAGKADKALDTVDTAPGKPATLDEQLAGLSDALKVEPVTGREHADAAITGDETVETMAAKDAAGNDEATTKALAKIDKLKADPEAAHLHGELAKYDPANIDGQRAIGELYVKHRLAQKAKKDLADDRATLKTALEAAPEGEGGAHANDYAGADKKVYELMDGPEWADFSDEHKRSAAQALREAVQLAERGGTIPRLKARRDVFGTDPVSRLMRVYQVLGSSDPAARERFFGALDRMVKRGKRDDGLEATVLSSLPDNVREKIRPDQVDEFIAGMKTLSSEKLSQTMAANELKVTKTKIDDHLFSIFGDKAESVIAAFAKHAKENDELVPPDVEEAGKLKSVDKHKVDDSEETTPPGEGETGEDGLQIYKGEQEKYYGRPLKGGNESPFYLNNLAHAEQHPNSPEETRPQNERLARAQMENPDHDVRWMGAREFADKTGMSPEDLHRHTNGKPDDYGIAAARTRGGDEFALDDNDLKAMSIADHVKYFDKTTRQWKEKHLAAPDSWKQGPSAIHAGEHVFDATRIASYMARKDGKNMAYSAGDDEHGSTYRTARAFAEGIANLSVKLGRNIEVADNTVVVREGKGRPEQTWGHLRQVLADGKEAATADLAPLRKRRADLYTARDAIHEKLDKSSELDLGAEDLGNVRALMRQLEANKVAEDEVNKQIAKVRSKHDMDREQWDSNDKTTAELEKDSSKLTIQLDGAETSLARLEGKRALTERETKSLEFFKSRVDYLRRRVTGLEETLERRASEAQFSEAKELGDDNGTGRDAGSGILLHEERARVARAEELRAAKLLDELGAAKPGSPQAAAIWAKAAKHAAAAVRTMEAQIKSSVKTGMGDRGSDPGGYYKLHQEQRRRAGYKKIVDARDIAALQRYQVDAASAAFLGRQDAIKGPARTAGDDFGTMGVREVDPLGQIHQAAAEHKGRLGEVATMVRQIDKDYTEPAKPKDINKPVTPEARWATLNDLADDLAAKGKGGLRALLDNREIMTDVHQKELGKLVGEDGTLESTAKIGSALKHWTDMYSTSTHWSAKGEHAWANKAAEGGEVHEAILRKIAKSTDATNAHTRLLELLVDKNPNEHKAKVIDALNARIGEIVERDPQQAYDLQLKSTQEKTAAAPTPAQKSFYDKVTKGGLAAKGVIDTLAKGDDVAALQRAARALRAADTGWKSRNEHIDHALSVIADRLAQLDGKTHYSRESTRVHEELERDGFPAAHDSPIRHDGTFNWREHKGKGEGNAVYGAGTYLSSADGVHQSYKKQFTAAIKADTFINDPKYQTMQEELANLKWGDKTPANLARADELRSEMKAFEDRYKTAGYKNDTSPTYHVTVDIPAGQLLDWDARMPEQSELVQKALGGHPDLKLKWNNFKSWNGEIVSNARVGGHLFDIANTGDGKFTLLEGKSSRGKFDTPEAAQKAAQELLAKKDLTGEEVYATLADKLGSKAKASDHLQSLGILGHKYASDGGNDYQHPNYVIYDDAKIRTNYTELSREKKGSTDSTAKQQADVHAYVNKVTGGNADVNAAARLLYSGSYIEGKTVDAVDYRPAINVSVHALNPLSTAYHESLHWFADHLRQHGDPKVMAALSKAADSPYVRNFLRSKFKDQPEALKQVEESAEERIAYMYQFHKNGDLQLGTRAKTVLDHISDFFKKILGVWSNDARALHIMDYFGSGKYAEAMAGGPIKANTDFAHRAMMEVGRNRTLDRLHANIKPLRDLASAMGAIGSARVRDFGIPALTKIADMVRLQDTKEGVDGGYLPAAGLARRTMGLDLVNRMTDNGRIAFTPEQANEAFSRIGRGEVAGRTEQETLLMNGMRTAMGRVHAYLKAAGVDVGSRGVNADYTPRVWDPAYVAGHQDAFRAMIQKYVDSGDFKGNVNELMSRLMRDDGAELESPTTARPGDAHVNKRDLHFIEFKDAEPFLEKNAMRVLSSYITQASRRAEWSRRFEQRTPEEQARFEAMTRDQQREDNINRKTPLDVLRDAAVKQGATPEHMQVLEKYLLGVAGQLGPDVSPGTRKLFAQVMVYQNLRLLPLGFFSTMIDPIGVKIRGGSWGDVFNNLKRGILEIPRGFKDNPKKDAGYQFAEDMGVIDSAVLQHVLGMSYGLGAAGHTSLKVNEAVFKFNLMDQMNTSQRVGATEAAMRFMLNHRTGDATEHSMRYLGELGLKPADIKTIGTGKDMRVAVRQADFIQLGMNRDAALEAHLKMRQAVNRWVDGAILRPDQSNKAIWMNDPMYALVAHMKQFSFAFQDVILNRVIHESRHGNYQPAVALAGYIPTMLAADLVKGMVQGGGSQPDWKHDWGIEDYLASAFQRAGLFGVGQFGIDAIKDLHHGGSGIGALGGPTVSQLAHIVSTVGGRRSLEATVIDAMPANSLWSGYLPGGGGDTRGGSREQVSTELNTVD
jgi:hypothetical protein